jgi:lipopolysaccharide cholinephosphotransferase
MDQDNQYGVLEVQKHLLVLLKEFHSFCIQYEIKYSLDWGSLLGAIRHKGFIPWDDDLDIMVDRANFNKLISVIENDGRFVLDNSNPRTLWITRIRKKFPDGEHVYPPTIDILIVDNAPDNRFSRRIRIFLVLLLQGMLKFRPNLKKGNPLMRICTILTYYFGKLFSRRAKVGLYDKVAQLSDKKKTRQITCYYEEYNCLDKYYAPDLLHELITTPFEDTVAYIVKQYHSCLTIQFGDNYMTPIKEGLNHTEKVLKRLNENA